MLMAPPSVQLEGHTGSIVSSEFFKKFIVSIIFIRIKCLISQNVNDKIQFCFYFYFIDYRNNIICNDIDVMMSKDT